MARYAWGKPRFQYDVSHFTEPLHFGSYQLAQIGDLSSGEGYVCGEHQQPCFEISYCLSGKAEFITDGVSIPLKKGEIILNKPGQQHAIRCGFGETIRHYYIGFDFDNTMDPEDQKLFEFFCAAEPCAIAVDHTVEDAFNDIFFNLVNTDEFSEHLVADALRKLFVTVYRIYTGAAAHRYPTVGRLEKDRVLSELCSYLDYSVDDMDALKQLSNRFEYSYSYLARIFSDAMGESLKSYFLNKRFAHACELLAAGKSVTEVSEQMGYASIHTFSHAFSARYGMAPSEYIKTEHSKETLS